MSHNVEIQKKRLIKEGAIALIVLLVLGGLAGLASYLASQNEQKILMLQGQFNAAMGQLSDLERKHEIIKESVDEFLKIKSDIKSNYYNLNREKASEVLSNVGREHRIDKIDTQMSPIETLSMPEATFQRADAQFSDIHLTFKAMSDLHVYAFIESLMQELPGIKKMTSLRITPLDSFKSQDLVDMSTGKKPELVQAEVSFLWLGIRLFPLDPSGNPIPPQPAPGATP
ncbi:MAG: hypothetical protein U1E36_01695 [Rickettsiales bacterium]